MQSLLKYQCFSSQLLVCDSFRQLAACQSACPRSAAARPSPAPVPLAPAHTAAGGALGPLLPAAQLPARVATTEPQMVRRVIPMQ